MNILTTIAVLASFAITPPPTVIQDFTSKNNVKKHSVISSSSIISERYQNNMMPAATVADISLFSYERYLTETSNDDVYSKITEYGNLEDGWDGAGSVPPTKESIKITKQFILGIPAVFPLPKPMLASDGTIGMYWDDSVMYIDIQIEENNYLSLFSRNRLSETEKYIDAIEISKIDSNWYFDNLTELLRLENIATL